MLEGINTFHAKIKINILKNKKVIELLGLWQIWMKKEQDLKRRTKEVWNSFQSKTLVIISPIMLLSQL